MHFEVVLFLKCPTKYILKYPDQSYLKLPQDEMKPSLIT